ncbi:alpha/beta hydrolase [Dyadobacter sp. NIV53]|uniref:alpha/beta hydrolase n=1 Tax=Dyadobacter sp. NIV53 TaxID=2861765 RepID=UPI001C88187E|nr:alpha/beta hydrolase [Dyadobacter sp. NIV53]
MKRQILFIHSAEKQGPERGSGHILSYLNKNLGNEYEIISPKMPGFENPQYESWKNTIDKKINSLQNELILIGHSLGGSVLLKYLSEQKINTIISGLFLIAAPYWEQDSEWNIEEFIPHKEFASRLPQISSIFLYHSRDDQWVPFSHVYHYSAKLPDATVRKFGVSGHNFIQGFPEIIKDIKELP